MRTCRGGKRWQEVSRLLHYLARRSSLIRQKSGHNFHHSPVIGRIQNFASFPWNSRAISSPSWLWRSRCYVGKLSAIPTPDCFKAVFCSELWAHFYARCIRAALRHRPSVAVQLWSEEKKKEEVPEWNIPHLSSHADCRPGRVNFSWISIPMIGRSQLYIYKHWHRCERALLKSAELSSIRFKYCKGSTRV